MYIDKYSHIHTHLHKTINITKNLSPLTVTYDASSMLICLYFARVMSLHFFLNITRFLLFFDVS